MQINDRQLHLLSLIVEEYVKTAEPVSSSSLVTIYNIHVSSATVRNDMVVLEQAGLLRQPHTSSGRVPTEEGYRVYLEYFVKRDHSTRPSSTMCKAIDKAQTPRDLIREMARCLTEMSGETTIATLDVGWNHYTGISNLFDKPEFSDVKTLRAISSVVDKFDDILRDVFGDIEEDVNVWIGAENPFGKQMATLMVKYHLPNGMVGTLGLIGPLRMDYEKNIRLLGQAKELLDKE